MKLEVRNLEKRFRDNGTCVEVLDGVDLDVGDGEFVSVIGPSGCGKTTLLNCIAGLEEPDTGLIKIEGEESPSRLGRVGYMPQKDLLFPWRTVLENALIGMEVRGHSQIESRKQAGELMERFGLNGFEDKTPSVLSGGMRQRVAFMRTLMTDQELIVLDEPFGALDAFTRHQMQEWLVDIWGSMGKTIILITHDIDEALLLSDKVFVLTVRPASVKLIVNVPLPRPRRYRMVTDMAFIALKEQLIQALWDSEVKE